MLKPDQQLSTKDHRRDLLGMHYVYPVVSRRAGGVSVGINLNPNNACNWRCVYCQVEGLQRGGAPELDLAVLREELHALLQAIIVGDFMQRHVPAGLQRLNDIALSGNGEPTTSPQMGEVIAIIHEQMQAFALQGKIKLVLISNGSQMHKSHVQQALRDMAQLGGEVWFKLDRARPEDILQVNQIRLQPDTVLEQLRRSSACCPTWIQSCFFAWDGQAPDSESVEAYLQFLRRVQQERVSVQGVLLYGIARPSMQPEAARLSALSESWMQGLAAAIAALGFTVKLSV